MEVTKLPLDNLYKTVAVLGVVAVLFSFTYPDIRGQEINSKSNELQLNIQILRIQTDHLKKRINFYTGKDGEIITNKLSDSELYEYMNDSKELEISLATIESKISEISDLSNRLKKLNYLALLGKLFGSIFLSAGFLLWYFKTQQHQDFILQSQSKKETISIKNIRLLFVILLGITWLLFIIFDNLI